MRFLKGLQPKLKPFLFKQTKGITYEILTCQRLKKLPHLFDNAYEAINNALRGMDGIRQGDIISTLKPRSARREDDFLTLQKPFSCSE
jgi:hypothetical protein